ncbi:MAG: HupE/UreJ family protein [Acidobacteriota bacterium]|nr:HupE/UreJ family protein [Acidobacteriota bacterium]
MKTAQQALKPAVKALMGLLAVFIGPAYAHESRPLTIEIIEREDQVVLVQWRIPPSVPDFNAPEVTLSICKKASPLGKTQGIDGSVRRQLYTCPEDLDGVVIQINYPMMNPSVATLMRVYRLNGETHSVLASPSEHSISLPEAATTSGVAREYFVLGVAHIWMGYDHLLFVACLVLIAGTLRRMLITITGFTIAHSITLALAALELVRIPVPPVEATIALSIVFLATELVRKRRDTITWRYPIAVSASFGLLHGFGFASVLGEIGLPSTEIPAALLFFNIGVEGGQIAFVLVLVGAFLLVRSLLQHTYVQALSAVTALNRIERLTGYVVGTLAAFWLIQRVSSFWG